MNSFVCFGEVLWDVFPNEKKIGGAPLNLAARVASFSNNVAVISAIGNDALGKTILNFCREQDIKTDHIQILENYTTGEVEVSLNAKGSASYTIVHPKAWDKIQFLETQIPLIKNADVFVFGSLVTRDKVSKGTLLRLLEIANYKVFDVNLRSPFYSQELLVDLMNKADFIKFNDEELFEISKEMGSEYNNLEQNLLFIAKKTKTTTICVTKGAFGAVLFFEEKMYYNSGYQVEVKDTVGSGDSFLGTLLHFLQSTNNPQQSIDYACAVGALVAANKGANPEITDVVLRDFMKV